MAILNGLYTIKNDYFDDFPDINLKNNKNEKRPFYYCVKDEHNLLWMLPLSSSKAKVDLFFDN
jgi:hypothetical protein